VRGFNTGGKWGGRGGPKEEGVELRFKPPPRWCPQQHATLMLVEEGKRNVRGWEGR